MKKILTIPFLLSSAILFSQGVLKGTLRDTVTKTSLSLATITVFKAKDTTIVSYRLSDPQGNFKVPGLPFDIGLRVVITSSGYKVARREFLLESAKPELDLGQVIMSTDTAELDEVLVYAERPPVSFKKDTLEFNASAFKTLPTALVEDLLKKLPGVEVDAEGNMRVNGRVVNKLLVDGREFFGGDPKIATRNLPANLIDKVQVVDDKEQLERNPDITKGELGQVINLKLKRSIKQGWFGKAYAGGGSGARTHYEAGGIVNSFRDTLQLSVLAYTNNLNKAGFGFGDLEKLGGFGRTGINSIGVWSDGGVSLNGVSFGGTGQGLQRSTGAGINMNHDPNNKIKINFQYFFGQISSDYQSKSNSQQFIKDTVLQTTSNTKDLNEESTHRFATRLQWKIDSTSNMSFWPAFEIRNSEFNKNLASRTSNDFTGLLNESKNLQNTDANELTYSHDFDYGKAFRKKGRRLTIFNTMRRNSTDNSQTNNVETIFYDDAAIIEEQLAQLRRRDYENLTLNTSIIYYEPISKEWSSRLGLTNNYFKNNDELNTFDWNPNTSKYEVLNSSLSNGLERKGTRNSLSAGVTYTHKKFSISPGVQYTLLDIDNIYLKTANLKQRFNYVFPTLTVRMGVLNFGYRSSAREPSATDLRPVVDNSNPLYQVFGNPDLVPTVAHDINAGFFKSNPKTQTSINLNFNLSIEDNAIIRERSVDEKGIQITRPINIDGQWRLNGNASFSRQYKLINSWQISLRPGVNAGYNKSFIAVNSIRSGIQYWNASPNLNTSFNWKDIIELTQRYSLNFRKYTYESDAFKSTQVVAHYLTSEIVIRRPKNWVWESSIDYRHNPQVSPGISKNITR
ncbi:MAG: outer membrane beta-barrel protein, partial [Chitinophagaceae bacterium]|nr:outer membrane beta-barrel protein [Chitinophagaceae bacterium]